MALNDGLVSYWKCDEASGNLVDSFGSNNLTANNTPGVTTGKIGGARQFDGASSRYFSVASNSTLQVGGKNYFINLWVYLTNDATRGIIAKETNTTTAEFRVDLAGSRFRLIGFDGAGHLTVLTLNTFGAPSLSTWYMLSVWYDGTNLNGCVNNGTVDSTAAGSNGTATNTAAAFEIGRQASSPAYWDGRLDEIAFFTGASAVKNSTDRATLYNSGNGQALTFGGPFPHHIRRSLAGGMSLAV